MQRHYFANKGPSSQSYGFSSSHVWMWELDSKDSWVPKKWSFWTMVLEKTLESSLECKEIQPVHPNGDQSRVFTGRTDVEAETPVLWSQTQLSDWSDLIWSDHVQLFVTTWTVAHQAPLSMEILQARILECTHLSFLQGNFLTQESNKGLLHCRQIFISCGYQGSYQWYFSQSCCCC